MEIPGGKVGDAASKELSAGALGGHGKPGCRPPDHAARRPAPAASRKLREGVLELFGQLVSLASRP